MDIKAPLMLRMIVLIAGMCGCMAQGMAQKVLPLYEGIIPNAIASKDEEVAPKKPEQACIPNISRPTLTVFLPEKEKATGAAVVVVPGGGYGVVCMGHEGYAVAAALNKMGVAAIILKYRLPSDKIMKDKTIGPLQDAQQAIKVTREHAAEWGIQPERIGIMGFSAGGHLASTAGTHFNQPVIENKKGTSLRPDFMILVYPVISFQENLTHVGSRTNLIGEHPSAAAIDHYSNEMQVTPETPPTFLIHAGDDKVVKVENSIRFYESLHKEGVAAEMLIYPLGGHGFGIKNPTTPDNWMEQLENWMSANGWMKR
jgi:acetyl esterase/lipase